jgi:type I restriction enzyme S subunit
MQYKKIGDKDVTTFIQYGISIDMNENGVGYKIYRMNEIENMFCSNSVSKYADISREEMQKFKLKNNDILFNRTNSFEFVGRTGIFKEFSKEDFIFASYLVRLRTNEKLVLPEYLTVFLNTRFGISEIKRRARISINQSNVSASELQKIEMPIIEMPLQEKIRDIFNNAFKILQKSKSQYSEAEGLLIKEMELKDYTFGKALAFEANMNDSTLSKRFDADYFQPKYKEIIKKIESYNCGSELLGNIVKIKDKNFFPEENAIYKYIELANIVGQGEIEGYILEKGKNLPTRARRITYEGDLIISSIEGSSSCCALIHKEHDGSML